MRGVQKGIAMAVFATPDFEVSFVLAAFVVAAGAVILLLALIGFIVGMRMRRKGSRAGGRLALFSVLFPVFCYFAPSLVFRLEYGHFPLGAYPDGKIETGMTPKEVQAILGAPQLCTKLNGQEEWYYHLDSFGIYYFAVHFGSDGHVHGTHGN
jgi:hypothetical protein